MLSDAHRERLMGENGLHRVLAEYSWERVCAKTQMLSPGRPHGSV